MFISRSLEFSILLPEKLDTVGTEEQTGNDTALTEKKFLNGYRALFYYFLPSK